MKVAVVHNQFQDRQAIGAVISRYGQPCPESYALKHVELVVQSLTDAGHTAARFEGDRNLLTQLAAFLPADPLTQGPGGMVFNMAYGIQGDTRYTHIPAMLEMAGIPYTGASPLGHSLALDKVVTKILMQSAGIPTPAFRVLEHPNEDPGELRFPLVVKPRHESTSYGLRLVHDRHQLAEAVAAIVAQYQQGALVEEYVDGREICVGLLGNAAQMQFLPPVELDFGDRPLRILTWEDKYHKRYDEPEKVCPAPVDDALREQLNQISLATFRACHLKDYARVDLRIDAAGQPWVLEINSMASLGTGGSFVKSAAVAGYSYAELVNRILDVAHQRCFGLPATAAVSA